MGLFDVPNGVTPQTGLLLRTQLFNPGAGSDSIVTESWNLGGGFAVGIHGYQLDVSGWTGADGEQFDYEFNLDPNTIAVNTNAGSRLFRSSQEANISTSGALLEPFPATVFLPGPILTVQNAVHTFTPVTTAMVGRLALFYSIYRVSDSDFIRIAGVSLSRG